MNEQQFHLESISAILCVNDIKASIQFYEEMLGFTPAEWGDDNFTSINRDHTGIYLCRNGQGNPGTWIWIGFGGDIFALYDRLKEKGAKIVLPPTNYPWAYEMHIKDPDGHILRLGTDPKKDEPFATANW
jgi:predicted enzyme related to lactoylglutathione lyase